MSRVNERKRGRVTCAWCKGDMGEAKTGLDTHGCCLGCLKSALREMDERLSAFGQGQEDAQRARERGRSEVSVSAKLWRGVLSECWPGFLGLEGAIGAVTLPRFEELPDLPILELDKDWRWCVPGILQEHWGELSMEARLAILAMAQLSLTA